jgi:hypothetical protein
MAEGCTFETPTPTWIVRSRTAEDAFWHTDRFEVSGRLMDSTAETALFTAKAAK